MKLPLNWLKDYIDPKLSTEALIERLTMAGLEVEAIDYVAGDTVLEIEITPNRPDCLNILGLAQEIGAITGKKVKFPKIGNYDKRLLRRPARAGTSRNDTGIDVQIESKKDCSRYIATLIKNVAIEDSPAEIKKRLAAVGTNAINNAVDVTNFVLMEIGQPLHAFDYDKLVGGKINVRRAKAGEKIVTLDGVERKLDPSILVIADAQKPVAIAGIMGGAGTEITAETKNILLESAHFDMGLIRRACRSLGLRSESSYRFERNVNFEGVLTGANRATDLLLPLTNGKLTGRAEISSKLKASVSKITVRLSEIESVLGFKVTGQQVKAWLVKLGFKVSPKAGTLIVVPPINRTDIAQEVDIIEEIARMIGFDHLPSSLPTIKLVNITIDKKPREIKNKIRQILTAAGIDEIITLSMINSKALARTNITQMPGIKVFNPLSQDQELMRPVLLPSFLQVAQTNLNRGQRDLRLFEIAKAYSTDKERETLGILLTGRRSQDWRSSKKEGVDIVDIKGTLERIFQSARMEISYETVNMPTFEPGAAAFPIIAGKQVGVIGKVNRQVLANWDIKNQDVFYAAIYLDEVISNLENTVKYQPISEFPAVIRDVSLAVKKEIPYKNIEKICFEQGGDILRQVQFIEQYLGDKIQSGHKGLVFSCLYQSNVRTLREDEVSTVHERILQTLTRDLQALRR